jgi:hypothetical protein
MESSVLPIPQLFASDAAAMVNGFARFVSHLVMAPFERVARACDVEGLLAARRERRGATSKLFRAAERDDRRSRRRRGVFGFLHYLSELT